MADENEWQFLGSDIGTGSGDDQLDVTGMTSHVLYQIINYKTITAANVISKLRFNNNSDSEYAFRKQVDGGADSTATTQNHIAVDAQINHPVFIVMNVVNILGEEKLIISHLGSRRSAGAASIPNREEVVGKFVPSPDVNITEVNIFNDETGDYSSDCSLDVSGVD